jgi:hypothetical protein
MVSSTTVESVNLNSNDLPANKLDKLKRQTPSRGMIKSTLVEHTTTVRNRPNNNGVVLMDKESKK